MIILFRQNRLGETRFMLKDRTDFHVILSLESNKFERA